MSLPRHRPSPPAKLRPDMKYLLLPMVALLAAVGSLGAAPAVGEEAPDFALPTADGGTETLASHRGKFVVLEWTSPACPMVQRQYVGGHMQKLQAEETGRGVVWLTINSSAKGKEGHVTAAQAMEWIMEKQSACTAFLLDAEGKVGRLYGAKATPHLFIIGPAGKLIYSGAIDSIASADPAALAKATNYVRVGLQEARAGKALTHPTTRPYGCAVRY